MSPKWAFLVHFVDISYNVFFFIIEETIIIHWHELSKAILYQAKPLEFNNTFLNSRYLRKFICQVLVLQSSLYSKVTTLLCLSWITALKSLTNRKQTLVAGRPFVLDKAEVFQSVVGQNVFHIHGIMYI